MEYVFTENNQKMFPQALKNQLSQNYTYYSNVKIRNKQSLSPQPQRHIKLNYICSGLEEGPQNSTENIKFIWCSEYSSEIVESLKEAEKKRRKIHYKSPQKEFRASLVQVIRYSAEILGLGRTTVHLAVYLLDVFMDTYRIIQSKLNAVALTCLLLASKIEERDTKVPKLDKLSQISRTNGITEFKKAEIRLLKFFEWNLLFPTGATYLEYYIPNILSQNDIADIFDNAKLDFATVDEITDELKSLIFEILDLTLQDQSLVQINPSITAAACIAATRTSVGLHKWNNNMYIMTGYEFSEIEKIYEILLQMKKKRDLEAKTRCTTDSGFLPSSDSETDSDEFLCVSHPFKRRRLQ